MKISNLHIAILMTLFSITAQGGDRFLDATGDFGLEGSGFSFGAAAADFDKDGDVDLAVSQACKTVNLYQNEGGDTFTDVTGELGLRFIGDVHGLAWVDMNNDGWLDLFMTFGAATGRGGKNNQLYINREGKSFELAELSPPLADYYASNRTVCPVLLNDDALVDLIFVNHVRPGRSTHGMLLNHYRTMPLIHGPIEIWDAAPLAQDAFSQTPMDAVSAVKYPAPLGTVLISNRGTLFRADEQDRWEVANDALGLPKPTSASSTIPIDFDNDGDMDLIFLQSYTGPRGVSRKDHTLHCSFQPHEEARFRFQGEGTVRIDGRPRIRLGKEAVWQQRGTALSLDDPRLVGAPQLGTDDSGAFLYAVGEGQFEFRYVPRKTERLFGPDLSITWMAGSFQVEEQASNYPDANTLDLQLHRFEAGKFVEVTEAAGLSGINQCIDGIAGDFDNNGAMDLYLVRGTTDTNLPNLLLLNDGQGQFMRVEDGDLTGPEEGIGDTALAFDGDGDGRLDLFVQNGLYGPWSSQDGYNVFLKNTGVSGNWLQIDLVGTGLSNHSAVGARVEVETPFGPVMQQRMGMSNARAASLLPMHFGLGVAKEAKVKITWPSGDRTVDVLEAGKVHHIVQETVCDQ